MQSYQIQGIGFTDDDVAAVTNALDEGSRVVLDIKGLIERHLGEGELSEHVLGLLVTQMAGAIRFDPRLVTSERYQEIITEAFATVTDISDLSSTEFYLGTKPVNSQSNDLVGEYFAAVPFSHTLRDLEAVITPVHMILHDWGAAVQYCKNQGVPNDAFLRDGTNLFRFAPDALPYVHANKGDFPSLELRKVNNGEYVESWLTSAHLGEGEGRVPHDSWLVLLTGYVPNDNKAIPGLYRRYSAPKLSTALDIQNRRL